MGEAGRRPPGSFTDDPENLCSSRRPAFRVPPNLRAGFDAHRGVLARCCNANRQDGSRKGSRPH
jgi:hypothetical protein